MRYYPILARTTGTTTTGDKAATFKEYTMYLHKLFYSTALAFVLSSRSPFRHRAFLR